MSQATSQLQQQGMPSYVANLVNDQAASQTAQNTNPDVSADAAQQAQDQFGSQLSDLTNQLGASIVRHALDNKSKASGGGGASADGASNSAGGWLQAIAAAMGQALGDQAANLVNLSNTLSNEVQNPDSSTSSKTGDLTSQAQANNAAAARQFNVDMTTFQAQSQQYSILQNTFTTAIKSLGEALQGMARKS